MNMKKFWVVFVLLLWGTVTSQARADIVITEAVWLDCCNARQGIEIINSSNSDVDISKTIIRVTYTSTEITDSQAVIKTKESPKWWASNYFRKTLTYDPNATFSYTQGNPQKTIEIKGEHKPGLSFKKAGQVNSNILKANKTIVLVQDRQFVNFAKGTNTDYLHIAIFPPKNDVEPGTDALIELIDKNAVVLDSVKLQRNSLAVRTAAFSERGAFQDGRFRVVAVDGNFDNAAADPNVEFFGNDQQEEFGKPNADPATLDEEEEETPKFSENHYDNDTNNTYWTLKDIDGSLMLDVMRTKYSETFGGSASGGPTRDAIWNNANADIDGWRFATLDEMNVITKFYEGSLATYKTLNVHHDVPADWNSYRIFTDINDVIGHEVRVNTKNSVPTGAVGDVISGATIGEMAGKESRLEHNKVAPLLVRNPVSSADAARVSDLDSFVDRVNYTVLDHQDDAKLDIMKLSFSNTFISTNASVDDINAFVANNTGTWRWATQAEMTRYAEFFESSPLAYLGSNGLTSIQQAFTVAPTDVNKGFSFEVSDTSFGDVQSVTISDVNITGDNTAPLLVRDYTASRRSLVDESASWTQEGEQVSGDKPHFTISNLDGTNSIQVMHQKATKALAGGGANFAAIDAWLESNALYQWRWATREELDLIFGFYNGDTDGYVAANNVEWLPADNKKFWTTLIPSDHNQNAGASYGFKIYENGASTAAAEFNDFSPSNGNTGVALLVRDNALPENFNEFGDIDEENDTITISVSKAGASNNRGTSDAPLATVVQAKAAAALVQNTPEHATKKLIIEFAEGEYYVGSTLDFTEDESGSIKGTEYRAKAGENVTFTGNITLTEHGKFESLDATSAYALGLAPESDVTKIQSYDLKQLVNSTGKSIEELLGVMQHHGWEMKRENEVAPAMLYHDSERLRLARWPNVDDIATTESLIKSGVEAQDFVGQISMMTNDDSYPIVCGTVKDLKNECASAPQVSDKTLLNNAGAGGSFHVNSDRLGGWANPTEIYIDGVVSLSWMWTYNQITGIESADNNNSAPYKVSLQRGELAGVLGSKTPHFFFENVAEELDQPGEFYIDRDAEMLYVYPQDGANENGFKLSTLDGPLINLTETDNITFSGIKLTGGRASGVLANNVENLTIENCAIEGFSYHGIDASGDNIKVDGCSVKNIGAIGINIKGGTLAKLEGDVGSQTLVSGELISADNKVTNNVISNVGWDQRSQQPGIRIWGVGATVSGNDISNTPHFAIMIKQGAKHIVANNYIHDLPTYFKKDGGALYSEIGALPHYRGNEIIGNYFKDVPTNGIYLDNFSSGFKIKQNVFYNVGSKNHTFAGININGGGDHIMEDNIFFDVKRPTKYNHFARTQLTGNYIPRIKSVQDAFNNASDELKSAYTAFPDFVAFLTRSGSGSDIADLTNELIYFSSIARNNLTYNPNTTLQAEIRDEDGGIWLPQNEGYKNGVLQFRTVTSKPAVWTDASSYPEHGKWVTTGNQVIKAGGLIDSNGKFDLSSNWKPWQAFFDSANGSEGWQTALSDMTDSIATTISDITRERVEDIDGDGWYSDQDWDDSAPLINCEETNASQCTFVDTDGDGKANEGGKNPDFNDDNDDADDVDDKWPLDPFKGLDSDDDGIPNVIWTWAGEAFKSELVIDTASTEADDDDDNDGISDAYEDELGTNPLDATSTPADFDGNGKPDLRDDDIDGDLVTNSEDFLDYNRFETVDADNDGVGDNRDVDPTDENARFDTDNDGIADSSDRSHGSNLIDDGHFDTNSISGNWGINSAGIKLNIVESETRKSMVLGVSGRSADWQSGEYSLAPALVEANKTYQIRVFVELDDSSEQKAQIRHSYLLPESTVDSDGNTSVTYKRKVFSQEFEAFTGWKELVADITISSDYDASVANQKFAIWLTTPDFADVSMLLDELSIADVSDADSDGVYNEVDQMVNDPTGDIDTDNDGVPAVYYTVENSLRVFSQDEQGVITYATDDTRNDMDDNDPSKGLDTDNDGKPNQLWAVAEDGTLLLDDTGAKQLAVDQSTADIDDDGDSVIDTIDAFPLDSDSYQDLNGNGVSDIVDIANGVDVDGDQEIANDLAPLNKYLTDVYTVAEDTRLDIGQNLVKNGHFETLKVSPWLPQQSQGISSVVMFESIDADASQPASPQNSVVASIENVGGVAATIRQNLQNDVDNDGVVDLIAGKEYEFSARLWLPSNGVSLNYVYRYSNESGPISKNISLETGSQKMSEKGVWTTHKVRFTLNDDFVNDFAFWFKLNGGDSFKVDDVALYQVSDADSDGVVDAKDQLDNDASAYQDSDGDGVADVYYIATDGKIVDTQGSITSLIDSGKAGDAYPNDAARDTNTDKDFAGGDELADYVYLVDGDGKRIASTEDNKDELAHNGWLLDTTAEVDLDDDNDDVNDDIDHYPTDPARDTNTDRDFAGGDFKADFVYLLVNGERVVKDASDTEETASGGWKLDPNAADYAGDLAVDIDDDADGVDDIKDDFRIDPTQSKAIDADGDLWLTQYDPNDNKTSIPSEPMVDSDGDTIPDLYDEDDDNDLYLDIHETEEGRTDAQIKPVDTDSLLGEITVEDKTLNINPNVPVTIAGGEYYQPDSVDEDDDNDGKADDIDAFELDASEWADGDQDSIGDFADALPNDSGETLDSDKDGVGDNSDKFINDPQEWSDINENGVGDNTDALYADVSLIANGQFEEQSVNAEIETVWDAKDTSVVTVEQSDEQGQFLLIASRKNAYSSANVTIPGDVSGQTFRLRAKVKAEDTVSFACNHCKVITGDDDTENFDNGPILNANGATAEVVSNDAWVVYDQTFTVADLPQTQALQIWVRGADGNNGLAGKYDVAIDDISLVSLTSNRQVFAPSRFVDTQSFESDDSKDYWTANVIDGNKLDIMRGSVAATFGENSQMSFTQMDAAMAADNWRYASPAELTALMRFYANDPSAYIALNGGWSADDSYDHVILVVPTTDSGDERSAMTVEITTNGVGASYSQDSIRLSEAQYVALVVRDIDSDNDGVLENQDAFPTDAGADTDTDRDGIADNYYALDDNDVRTGAADPERAADSDFNGDGVLDADILTVVAPADRTVDGLTLPLAVSYEGQQASFTETSGLEIVDNVISHDGAESYDIGQYTITWTVTVTFLDRGERLTKTVTATQQLTVELKYDGSAVTDSDSFRNLALTESDSYEIFNLNGDSVSVMRLAQSANVGSDNASLEDVDAWLADSGQVGDTQWGYATEAQLQNLVAFFGGDAAQFIAFNGLEADTTYSVFGKNEEGELVSLDVSSDGFSAINAAAGDNTDRIDAAVLLIRAFVDTDVDGVEDSFDAFPSDYARDTDADGDKFAAVVYTEVDGERVVDTSEVARLTLDPDDSDDSKRFDQDNDGIADNGVGDNGDLCVGPEGVADCQKWAVYYTVTTVELPLQTEGTDAAVTWSERFSITLEQDDNGVVYDDKVTVTSFSVNGVVDESVVDLQSLPVSTLEVGEHSALLTLGYEGTSFLVTVPLEVIVVDAGKPVLTVNNIANVNTETTQASVSLAATATDTVDAEPVISYTVYAVGVDAPLVALTELNDVTAQITLPVGDYKVMFTAVDSSGNSADTVEKTVSVVDSGNPVLTTTAILPVSSATANAELVLSVAVTDTVDSAPSVNYSVVAAGGTDNTVVVNGDSASATVTLAIGEYTVTWTATDAAGNVGSATQAVVVTDGGAPVLVVDQDLTTTPAYPPFEATAPLFSDNLDSGVEASIVAINDANGNPVVDSDGNAIVNANTLDAGDYTLVWSAIDTAGNVSDTVSQPITILADITAPVFSGELADGKLPVISDFAPVTLVAPVFNDDVDGIITGTTITEFDGLTAGDYTIVWTAVDASGNVSQSLEQQVKVLSLTFDDISQIADVTLEATGVTTAVALPASVSVSGGAFNATPDITGPFALGTTIVNWSVSIEGGETLSQAQVITVVDTTAPVFAELATVTLPATGSLTRVGVAKLGEADVTDAFDGVVNATITSANLLPSGEQQVTWIATDSNGNTATATQTVFIQPRVSFGTNGFAETGSTATVDVRLSGEAAEYPVTVDVVLVSETTGHTATNTQVVIEEGLSASFEFDILANEVLTNGDKVELALNSASNAVLGRKVSHFTTVVQGNEAPIATVVLTADGNKTKVLTKGDDAAQTVVLTAKVRDINRNDTHNLEWNLNGLVDLSLDDDASTVELAVADIQAGRHLVSVVATENTEAGLQSTSSLLFVVKDSPIVLAADVDSDNDGISDADEGFADSDGDGIADFKDNNDDTSVLPLAANSEQVMQTEAGLTLKLGRTIIASKSVDAEGAALAIEDLAQFGGDTGESTDNAQDDEFQAISQIVDFEIAELPRAGMSVSVVLPMPQGVTLPANAIYRKYDSATGWTNFIADENNQLASSPLVDGVCPDTVADTFVQGLNEGDSCIRITIQDGGQYDQDGQTNGVVADPGAVVVMKQAFVKAKVADYELLAEGDSMVLTASDSQGAELQYQWTQTAGVAVTLEASGDSVTVTAPFVSEDQQIEMTLKVFNDQFEDTIVVPITVKRVVSQVTAVLTGTQTVMAGDAILIDALSSTDTQGLALNYRWQQQSGPTVNLENTENPNIYFLAPKVSQETQLIIGVVVSNGESSQIATHVVTVKPALAIEVNTLEQSNSGAIQLLLLLWLTVMAVARRRYTGARC